MPTKFSDIEFALLQKRVQQLERDMLALLQKANPRKGVLLVHDVSGSMQDFDIDPTSLMMMNRHHFKATQRDAKDFDELCLSDCLFSVKEAAAGSGRLFCGTNFNALVEVSNQYEQVFFYTDRQGSEDFQFPPNVRAVVLLQR